MLRVRYAGGAQSELKVVLKSELKVVFRERFTHLKVRLRVRSEGGVPSKLKVVF